MTGSGQVHVNHIMHRLTQPHTQVCRAIRFGRSGASPLPGLQAVGLKRLNLAGGVDHQEVGLLHHGQHLHLGLAQRAEGTAGVRGVGLRGSPCQKLGNRVADCSTASSRALPACASTCNHTHLPQVKRLPSDASAIECCTPAAAATTRWPLSEPYRGRSTEESCVPPMPSWPCGSCAKGRQVGGGGQAQAGAALTASGCCRAYGCRMKAPAGGHTFELCPQAHRVPISEMARVWLVPHCVCVESVCRRGQQDAGVGMRLGAQAG